MRDVFVARPFEGLASEAEWVALRELVPAATAPLQLSEEYAQKYPDRSVTLATVLPMAWPAMVRQDGGVLVGLQRQFQSGDVSRDIAASLLSALDTEVGQTVGVPALPGPGPRLQDVLADGALDVSIRTGFDFWLAEGAADDPNVAASLERANDSIYPTERLAAAPAAYWCQVPDKAHVRWVLAEDEDAALAGLARLSASGALTLGDGTRFAGMFRAHGLLVPVWDVPMDAPAADWEQPLAAVRDAYRAEVGSDAPLTPEQRRAREGLLGRQLTLR
ncbi:preprotein translocase SecA [Actinocatenispora rupis]|uniref:Preprotein translocase SecA n=1 Tax=Actinocatenispora rupis TaxID=519421 RepID=A0A8J3J7L8_9ACTN|nr:preprotein translocase SecA [Actinocatenispora rupis]